LPLKKRGVFKKTTMPRPRSAIPQGHLANSKNENRTKTERAFRRDWKRSATSLLQMGVIVSVASLPLRRLNVTRVTCKRHMLSTTTPCRRWLFGVDLT
jgi:hypothetical protein